MEALPSSKVIIDENSAEAFVQLESVMKVGGDGEVWC